MTECLRAYCGSPTPRSHILPSVQHTCIFIPPSLHIFFCLKHFLSYRGQFTPSLLSISLLLALSHCQFRARGTAFIFHAIHTYSSSTQKEETPSKIQLQPLRETAWAWRGVLLHVCIYIFIYTRPLRFSSGDYLRQPDWASRRQVLFN